MRPTAKYLTVVLLLIASSLQARGFLDDYQEGRKAAQRRDWSTTVRLMTAAIEQQPKEGDQRDYGTIWVSYYPYYYRGVALLELGQFEKALDDLRRTKGPGKRTDAVNLGGISDLVYQAESRLKDTKQQPVPPVTREPERVVVPVTPPVEAPAAIQVQPPAAKPPEARTDAPPKTAVETPVAQKAAVVERPSNRAITPAVKTEVRKALAAYFDGDFAAAEKSLSSLCRDEQKTTADLWLYLAASRYYRHKLGGGTDAQLLASAEQAYREAKRLNRDASFDPRFFPPRVREHFKKVR